MKLTSILAASSTLLVVGLALNGISSLALAQQATPLQTPEVKANNALRNAQFTALENGLPVGWNAFEGGFEFLPGQGYKGSNAVSMARVAATGTARGIWQSVVLDQKEASPITLSGWSRAEGVSGTPDNDYAVYADLVYADGTNNWGIFAPFPVGTTLWSEAKIEIKLDKAVKSMTFYALLRNHTGKVWFSDLHVNAGEIAVAIAPRDVTSQNAAPQNAMPKELTPIVGQKTFPFNLFKATIPATGAALKVVPLEEDNHLANPNLENIVDNRPSGWQPWGEGFELREKAGRGGKQAVFIERGEADKERGIWQEVTLDQKTPSPILLSGWSRSENVSGTPDGNYSLYADLKFQDGTELWGQSAPFGTGTHDWQQVRYLLTPEKAVKSIRYYALFRAHTGRVWLSDLSLGSPKAPAGAALFDALAVQVAPQPPIRQGELAKTARYRTQDGLSLEMQGGHVASLKIDGRELTSSAPSGFLVRDVANVSDYHSLAPGRNETLQLQLESTVSEAKDHLIIEGRVADLSGKDRAISLVFALPVASRGWSWNQTVRESQSIGAEELSNTVGFFAGSNGRHSLYPFANIHDAQNGLAIAVDPDFAAQNRLAVNGATQQFYLAYDFGLTPEKSEARFRFVIYRTDPQWGFRSALAKMGAIFPSMFATQEASKKQGLWMPFTDIRTVQNWQDFGFRFREATASIGNEDSLKWDDENEILSFRYYEPMTWWMSMSATSPRTYENALTQLQQIASDPAAPNYRQAQAVLSSGFRDATGRYAVSFHDQPWSSGAVWSLNPDPQLPGESTGASLGWNPATRDALYKNNPKGHLDGEYLDSLEGYVTANLNFERDHFRAAQSPLTFDTATSQPAQHKALLVYDYTRWQSRDVHSIGKLMFANSVPNRFTFLAPALDVMGTETNWLMDGQWSPDSDALMSLRRSMSGPKPYLLLQNTDYEKFQGPFVEKYMQRALFYGMFPGFFSADAATKPYWENPAWYGRDRPFFKKYLPLIKPVAEAGWQALTLAKSDNPDVWLERFGAPGGAIYLTVRNNAGTAQKARLSLEAPLSLPKRLSDLVSGKPVAASNGGIEISLEADQTAVLKLG